MNITLSWLDWALVVVLIIVAVIGFRRGFWISMGTVIGAITGAFGGLFAMPFIVQLVPAGVTRIIAMIATTAILIWLGMAIGRTIGRRLRLHVSHPVMRTIDRIFGAIGNTAILGLLISLIAFSISSIGVPGITSALKDSRIVTLTTNLTPERVQVWLAQVRADVLDSSELPELDLPTTEEPVVETAPPEPTNEVHSTSSSSVRITGSAYECGQSQTGSGFAIANNRVITNAHVVAGVEAPQVESYDGELFTGEVVAFNPDIDVAVIALPGAQLPVVEFGDELETADTAFVLGFPSGGPHQVLGAEVQAKGPTRVANIYDENAQLRDVYQIASAVRQGNSGGALVGEDGRVVGVIFARAAAADIGYALSNAEVEEFITQAPYLTERVSTGNCLE